MTKTNKQSKHRTMFLVSGTMLKVKIPHCLNKYFACITFMKHNMPLLAMGQIYLHKRNLAVEIPLYKSAFSTFRSVEAYSNYLPELW